MSERKRDVEKEERSAPPARPHLLLFLLLSPSVGLQQHPQRESWVRPSVCVRRPGPLCENKATHLTFPFPPTWRRRVELPAFQIAAHSPSLRTGAPLQISQVYKQLGHPASSVLSDFLPCCKKSGPACWPASLRQTTAAAAEPKEKRNC